jgi:hypothetical protein
VFLTVDRRRKTIKYMILVESRYIEKNKAASWSRRQDETSLEIEDLRSNKTTGKLSSEVQVILAREQKLVYSTCESLKGSIALTIDVLY